jgi:hypothetical protein
MSSFCQGIICIIWITWNSCRSVLHPVVILPPLLSLSLCTRWMHLYETRTRTTIIIVVCAGSVWNCCFYMMVLKSVILWYNQWCLCLSVSLLGTFKGHCFETIDSITRLFWNLQRHKDTDADITISCVPMDYRYIYVPMLHIYPLPFSSDSRGKKTNHEITRSYGEQILVAIWTVNNRVTLTDWWCWCLFCGWVLYSRASEMHPLMKIDNNGQVIHFNEKPRHESLSSMVCL